MSTRPLLVVLGAFALASCGPDPLAPHQQHLESQREALARARQLWSTAGLRDYSYDFEFNCFCPYYGKIVVTVQNGAFASMVFADSGTAVDASWFRSLRTMEGVFGVAQGALAADPDTLILQFDPTLGYPAAVWQDWYHELDGYMGLRVRLLSPVQP